MITSNSSPRTPRGRQAVATVCGLVLCLAASAAAQYPAPSNPVAPVPGTGAVRLVGIGGARSLGAAGFRLTSSFRYQRGAVWLVDRQSIANGFQTDFQFRISNPGGLIQITPTGVQRGGDGFAFVIQNFGIPVVGPFAGFLGYHGLPNSLAVEFDTWRNLESGFFDPNDNHISVHSRGLGANSVSETASFGRTTAIPLLKDGATHLARINYTPGTLAIYVDNLTFPALTIPGLDLSSLLGLDNGAAWVGFTAGTGSAFQTHDIYQWQFGQAAIPVPGGGTFPVTVTPTTPAPATPTDPFILPPPSTTTPTTPPGGTTYPPFVFPPMQ